MTKTIRHVSELPDWFDIRHYEQWEDKNPYEAAQAVSDRLYITGLIMSGFVVFEGDTPDYSKEASKAALCQLAETSKTPYERSIEKILIEMFHERYKEEYDYKEYLKKQSSSEDKGFIEDRQKEVQRILGYSPHDDDGEGFYRVTLRDVMEWMEQNKDAINEIEHSAQRLADKHGLDIEMARRTIQNHIPIQDTDGNACLVLEDYPTISIVLENVENYLRSLPFRHNHAEKARYSDVRKLFEYRVAAYADLMSWSHLTGCTITKKCLANALFPDGRYGEIDMMPSKTVGRFIQRVERGYIEDLTAKAAEMKSMQS